MADSSDMKNNEASNSAGDTAALDEESKPRIMKRARAGMISSSTDNSEDSEPDEKRPAFRLQPPTLIHGKAKPVPKPEETSIGSAASSSTKCKFLQPSKLSALSSSTVANKAAVANEEQGSTEPEPLVSSSNPFLLMAETKGNEGTEDSSDQTNKNDRTDEDNDEAADNAKVNGTTAEEIKPDSTTDAVRVEDKKKDETKSENLFAQAPSSTSANDSSIGNFVFGSKMEDRVVISGETKSPNKEKNNGEATSTGFVFGQNLSERAKVSSSTDSNPSFLPSTNEASSADSSSGTVETSQDAAGSRSPSSSDRKHSHGLKEDAAAHFLASQSRPALPEVEVKTGEEDEKNVLQIQCKLHQFDAANQNWLERGVGSLHLNDGKYSDDNLHFQSRLVMRVHGSLRLVLNTKIWPQMTVERASNKSVRVSAQTDDGSIGVFLITGTINDAEQIFRALEYRVLHQKQLEEKRKALEKKQQKEKKEDAKEQFSDEQRNNSCSQSKSPQQEEDTEEPTSNHKDKEVTSDQPENRANATSDPKSQSSPAKEDVASEKADLSTPSTGAPL